MPPVEADVESLRSVFTNLIINGLQAMDGKGGSITIKIFADDEHVTTVISDTGRGISPEHLPQVFEPYFSTKETGTGLGLAIAAKAVEDHGGTITVESQFGAGATFTVVLPAEHGERAADANAANTNAADTNAATSTPQL
ncbi:MAG: ATP-binding protein [Pyrinomonadaceae bacterium]